MEVYTDQPGVQLYTGNWMSGNLRGKHDHRYPARAALCLETQHYPDSPNKPEISFDASESRRDLPLDDDLPLHARSLAS